MLLLITIAISTSNVKADQYYKMAKVTCAPELGLFEITATGVANLLTKKLSRSQALSDFQKAALSLAF